MILETKLIFEFFWWHFFEFPKKIVEATKNFLMFSFYHFSIVDLLKTLFSPWRGYVWVKTTRGFDLGESLEVFVSNLISRILGVIARIFIIFVGLFFSFLILVFGILALFLWIFSPVILVFLILYGIFRVLQ
jgi:hypothetical protein